MWYCWLIFQAESQEWQGHIFPILHNKYYWPLCLPIDQNCLLYILLYYQFALNDPYEVKFSIFHIMFCRTWCVHFGPQYGPITMQKLTSIRALENAFDWHFFHNLYDVAHISSHMMRIYHLDRIRIDISTQDKWHLWSKFASMLEFCGLFPMHPQHF